MVVLHEIYQNNITNKYYYVHRITSNAGKTELFVHYYQVRSFTDKKKINKDLYYSENLKVFEKEYRSEYEPPPIPR